MSTPTAVEAVTSGVTQAKGDLLAVAGLGIGAGATLFAIRRGWAYVRSFMK